MAGLAAMAGTMEKTSSKSVVMIFIDESSQLNCLPG
jgi:hypothetical protein